MTDPKAFEVWYEAYLRAAWEHEEARQNWPVAVRWARSMALIAEQHVTDEADA